MIENFFGLTDIGKIRANNEDTFIAESSPDKSLIFAGVIDGVGGYEGGEVAAEIARETIMENLAKPGGELIKLLKNAFILANQKILTRKQEVKEQDQMACVLTLTVVDIEKNLFNYAHLGDTRLYLFRDDSLVKISKDHSFVGFLEDSGRLSEEAAMQHPKRNEINKALGFGREIEFDEDYIETGQSPFLPGDMLLLCSDGLSDLVNRAEITSILTGNSSIQKMGEELVAAANNKGGKDNITVVLVKNDKQPLKQEATKPEPAINRNEPPQKADSPIEENKVTAVAPAIPEKQKSQKPLLIVLSAICLVLAIVSILLWQSLKKEKASETTNRKLATGLEKKLQDAISSAAGDTLVLSDSVFNGPVTISDTLFINRDTLYIKAPPNFVLRRDSTYAGPALLLRTESKWVVLENINFENFAVAIAAPANALYLKNVRFHNCRIPIQAAFKFPDKHYVSGGVFNNSFKTDSVPQVLK